MAELTRGVLDDMLKSLEPKDTFVINIRDLLEISRMLRKQGFTLRRERGKRSDGSQWRLSRFRVLDGSAWISTLLVDKAGKTPRGGMYHFKTLPNLLETRPPQLKFDNDYSLDSILMHTRYGMK